MAHSRCDARRIRAVFLICAAEGSQNSGENIGDCLREQNSHVAEQGRKEQHTQHEQHALAADGHQKSGKRHAGCLE